MFASAAEAARHGELLILQAAGQIISLECQPSWRFPINGAELKIGNRAVRYTADFRYFDLAAQEWVVEDVKGMLTRDAALRIALMQAVHGIAVRLVQPRKRRSR